MLHGFNFLKLVFVNTTVAFTYFKCLDFSHSSY